MEKEEDAAKRGAPPALSYPVRARGEPVHGTYPRVYVASGRALPTRLPPGKVIHVPYTELVEANGAPKPAKDLWAVLTKAGLSRYAEIVTVSDDPGEAAANYFILRLMGYPDVRAQAL
jgi:3-mercaptopyruvate sulfurtransferase SseA